jgi:hypothetical protein
MKREDKESNLNGVRHDDIRGCRNKWHRSVNWSKSLYAIPNVLNQLESNLLEVSSCMDHPVACGTGKTQKASRLLFLNHCVKSVL